MPADVFTAHQQLALVVHKYRRVHGAAVLAQGLERANALAQAVEPFGGRQRCAGQHLKVWQRLFHCLHTAQTTAAGARQLAALLLEVPEGTAGDLNLGVLG